MKSKVTKARTKLRALPRRMPFSRLQAGILIAVLVAVGGYIIYRSLAGSQTASMDYHNFVSANPAGTASQVPDQEINSKSQIQVIQLKSGTQSAPDSARFLVSSIPGNLDSGLYKVCVNAKPLDTTYGNITVAAYDNSAVPKSDQTTSYWVAKSTNYTSELFCLKNYAIFSQTPGIQVDITNAGGNALNIASITITRTGDIATTAVKAFDTTATINDPSWFKAMYDAGYRLYILHTTKWGTCDPWPNAPAQIGLAEAAGLKVAAYTRDPRCWQNGILAAGQYQKDLQFFNLDIETDPGIPATRDMVNGIAAMGVRPVIYTGSGMWPNIMGSNANAFSDVPLWDTNVSSNYNFPDLLSPTPVQYGGWNTSTNMRIGIQQAFNVTVNGVAVDVNSFSASWLK